MSDFNREKWEAECDAETLATAEMIKKDPNRFASAKAIADDMAVKARERANSLDAISKKKTTTAKVASRETTLNLLTGL